MEQGPHWQPTTRQKSVGLAVLVVVLLIIAAYSAQWTGFPGKTLWKWTGFPGKTLWNWLQLLIVPLVIAAGGLWFNRRQQEREQNAQNRREREREAQEAAQRERELEVENERAQDEALQAYMEGMERLLIEKNLRRSPEGSEVRAVGRARTLTVLPRLDVSRKASILQFLYEAGLISDETKETTVVKLDKANLRGSGLRRANLIGANLIGANLSKADLSGAVLRGATNITNEELERQAHTLGGATMPNGQKYEEWLEDREGRGEDGV